MLPHPMREHKDCYGQTRGQVDRRVIFKALIPQWKGRTPPTRLTSRPALDLDCPASYVNLQPLLRTWTYGYLLLQDNTRRTSGLTGPTSYIYLGNTCDILQTFTCGLHCDNTGTIIIYVLLNTFRFRFNKGCKNLCVYWKLPEEYLFVIL